MISANNGTSLSTLVSNANNVLNNSADYIMDENTTEFNSFH